MKVKKSDGTWTTLYTKPIGDTLPIGSISAYSGENIPTNWLKCNGEAISRTDYPELFKTIGTTYGRGDGSTTFNLPNISERVIVGNNGDGEFSLGNTGGEKEHKLTIDEMPRHQPQALLNTGDSNTSGSAINWQVARNGRFYGGDMFKSFGGDQAHNNMQPYIALNYIIKAKQSVGLVGNVASDMNDVNDNAVPNAKTVKNYIDKKQTYSTKETVIGTWLGKPLYRKVINMGNLANNSGKSVAHNLSNFVIRTINGSATNGSIHIGISGFNDEIYMNNTNVIWNTKVNRSSFTAYVVLEYTKTTD